ncbi:MAG: peptidylprolyl isomerase [Bdellovibrionales bacterium]|nr:peptidylprolyl isomerase [Bdellovibrionales bacterium]
MRKYFVFAFCVFLLSCTSKHDESITILKIGNSLISEKDFSQHLMDEAKNYNSVFLKDSKVIDDLKQKVVLNIIIEELLLSWGKEQKLLLSPEEIDGKIKDQIKSYPNEQAFKRVYSELKLQTDLLRRKTQVTWLKDRLLSKIKKNIQLTDKDIKNYYYNNTEEFKHKAKIKLQQIVVQTELEANKIHKAIKSGSPFGKLASEYSLGAEADNGGVVGWIDKGTLPVFDAAFNLPLNKLSNPKKSPYGYHIFRVLERKRGRQWPLNEVKEQISKKLQASRAEEQYKNWLEKQIQSVKVEKNEEALRNIQIDVKTDS